MLTKYPSQKHFSLIAFLIRLKHSKDIICSDSLIILLDEDGAVCEMLRPELGASIPKTIRPTITCRSDWEKLRDERLDPATPGRIPVDIVQRYEKHAGYGMPISLSCGSLYGWLRNWMGVEGLSIAVCEDPDWIEEMMEYLTNLSLSVLNGVPKTIRIDIGTWWEDMCFNMGPLLSPSYVEQWMAPRYRRIVNFVSEAFGCELHFLDCDGKIDDLAGIWTDCGITGSLPLEAAHTDIFALRKQFGKRVLLRGGFDKRALIAGKDAIDVEIERLRPLVEEGGFIPHTDHLVPPDVSWENYLHYRKRKCELIGRSDAPPT